MEAKVYLHYKSRYIAMLDSIAHAKDYALSLLEEDETRDVNEFSISNKKK